MTRLCWITVLSLLMLNCFTFADDVQYASPCEVCKIVSLELENRLKETGKSHEIIETGYNIEAKKEKKKYQTS